jgi:hypothetical protein
MIEIPDRGPSTGRRFAITSSEVGRAAACGSSSDSNAAAQLRVKLDPDLGDDAGCLVL